MSHLPILVPGRSNPINVPCRLPECFTFSAFLPSRGLREFTCWITSTDPLKAEVGAVTLNGVEGDPRIPHAYELDEDEQRRADEAAADVLVELLNRVGLHYATRRPVATAAAIHPHDAILHATAIAHEAECKAWEALRAAHVALHGRAPFYDADPSKDELAGPQWASKSARLLETYVERTLDAACLAQKSKAEAQRDAHATGEEDDAGSERVRAPRTLDVPTLKCLDVNY